MSKYAHKVRKDDVIGFIDTSMIGNGGSGILFAKDGIAFEYAGEKIFVKYEEIYRMHAIQGKKLNLCGIFLERNEDYSDISISGNYFDVVALKECIEEIQRYI